MAAPVITRLALRAIALGAAGALGWTTSAAAQPVKDPTLPPPLVRASSDAVRTHATDEPPRVALILRSGERRSAVIDGHGVHEGDVLSIAGTRWRVDRIDDAGVWLADGTQRRRLELFSASGRAVQRRERR